MCYRGGKFDMPHPLTAHLRQSNFNTTFLADNAAIFHPLIFTAQTFIITHGAKNTGAEQAVTFWLKGSVIDGFWLLDLSK